MKVPFVGSAGWSLRPHLAGQFEAGPNHLARYSSRFNAVEINSSFYRPHRQSTYARWAATVPPGFRFSVKVPKKITHESRLLGTDEAIGQFLSEAAGLADKFGAILVQLPPSLPWDFTVARSFFRSIREKTNTPIVCEARHPSWFKVEVDGALEEMGIERVIADPPVVDRSPDFLPLSMAYLRLHGAPRMYYSEYSAQHLEGLAERLKLLAATDVPAWCIFDNTAAGAALGNALEMRTILDRELAKLN